MSFVVEVASVPDRETVVAEIWFGDTMVAEVVGNEASNFRIEIYPNPNGAPWSFDLEAFADALKLAKERLSGKKA